LKNKQGNAEIHHAENGGLVEFIQLLIEAGALIK
jgi:hypothetical protein